MTTETKGLSVPRGEDVDGGSRLGELSRRRNTENLLPHSHFELDAVVDSAQTAAGEIQRRNCAGHMERKV